MAQFILFKIEIISDEFMDKWFRISRSDFGNEKIRRISFASVRKGDKVLVVPCHWDNCDCLKVENETFFTVKCITGYCAHVDSKNMDLQNPLQIRCPICSAVFQKEFARQDHLKKEHMYPKIKDLIRQNPPYLCPFYK